MALKITLKPSEKIFIGGAVITNGKSKCTLVVENKVAILRQKDILNKDQADTPARRIYFTVQLMYIDDARIASHHRTYWKYVRDFLSAAPGSLGLIDQISEQILGANYYKALKCCKKLIKYEQEVIASVQ